MSGKRDLQEIQANLNRQLAEAKRFQQTVAERIKRIDEELSGLKSPKKQSTRK